MEANSTTNPPKFSRYRTVRARAATLQTLSSQSDSEPPPPPLPKAATFTPANPDVSVKRAPSRYRRNNAVPAEAPPLPKIKDEHATTGASRPPKQDVTSPSRTHNTTTTHHDQRPHGEPRSQTLHSHSTKKDARRKENEPKAQRSGSAPATVDRYEAAREEARLILEGEYDRLHRMKAEAAKQRHPAGHAIGNHAPDMSRRKDTVKHKDQKSPKLESAAEQPATMASEVPVAQPPPAEEEAPALQPPVSPAASPAASPATPKRGLKKYIIGSPRQESPKSPPQQHSSPARVASPLASVKPPLMTGYPEPPSAAVQQFDAPVSASNAGDRRVTVKFDTSTITLPVTTSTTAKDLLNSASIILSAAPDPRTSTLLESYITPNLALERPLRRYERIRDVLNSWDSDTDQHLVILPASDEQPGPRGLELKDVPPSAGQDITLQMHHSARPGRWDKRWVRIQPNGQVSISKHEGGMDSTNICHLSDFDLYAPTRRMIKRLKPPRGKATVFAVKSQQKSAMFLDEDDGTAKLNFAHFFASGTKEVADRWYAAVHGWRSWYLVNVLGEGCVPASGTGEVLGEARPELRTHLRSGSHASAGNARPGTSASAETMPYQLGSFKPMLDLDFSKIGVDTDTNAPGSAPLLGRRSTEARRSVDLRSGGSPQRSGTTRGKPPTAFPSRFAQDTSDGLVSGAATMGVRHDDGTGFTGKGLLAQHLGPAPSIPDGAVTIEDPNAGFTGRGLLARSATQRSQGGRMGGRGVPGAGKNGQPLVDLSGHSEFADGSLLRQLEAWRVRNGEGEGKVDRE